jgi:hypothetical protein
LSLRGALATKQSSLHQETGLLRFARNDGAFGAVLLGSSHAAPAIAVALVVPDISLIDDGDVT